jgi:D-alanyl-D-alanine carboxypeptidase/D-alanyl-D-alanine-endopeptidase (penicillin-binding protein 4)
MTDAARRVLSLLAAAALVGAGPAAAQALQKRIDTRLAAPPLDRSLFGVVLQGPDGKQLYGRNADRMFIPASNTKLVVSAVAAALLPPEWTVTTSVYANGPVRGGVVEGDLILYGRGDPTMGKRCYAVDTTAAGACDTDAFLRLRELAGQLRARGSPPSAATPSATGSSTASQNGDWTRPGLVVCGAVLGLGFNDNSIDFTYAVPRARRARHNPSRPTSAWWRSRTGRAPWRPASRPPSTSSGNLARSGSGPRETSP